MLAKDRDMRPQSVEHVLAQLDNIAPELDGLAPVRSYPSDSHTFPIADESCRVRQRVRVWADSPN